MLKVFIWLFKLLAILSVILIQPESQLVKLLVSLKFCKLVLDIWLYDIVKELDVDEVVAHRGMFIAADGTESPHPCPFGYRNVIYW